MDPELIFPPLDSVKLSYESFLNVKYGLGYPFLKIKDEFFFFETYYLKLFKCNLIDSSWQSNFTYSTEEYKSTNKYIFAEGDSIIMISYFENDHALDIYSINKETLSLKILKKNLLIGEQLNTILQTGVFWDNNRIIIFLFTANKILTIDTKTYSLKYYQDSHLVGIRHDSGMNLAVISGKIGRNIFMYHYTLKRLFKFDLDTFVYSEIPVPRYVSSLMSDIWDRGGMVNNLFCFWPSDFRLTMCYDVNKNVWLFGGNNPFYKKWYMPLDYIQENEYSYYQNGSVIKRINVK